MGKITKYILISFLILLLYFSNSYGWDCTTHAYIAKKAGVRIPEAACMPDIIRDENYAILAPFHYHNAAPQTIVTPDYIDKFKVEEKILSIDGRQIKVLIPHQAGVLYWKIIDIYKKMKAIDKTKLEEKLSYEYYLVTIAHYIGDLSQPLHNFPYSDEPASDGKIYSKEGGFNKENHIKFDESFTAYLSSDPKINERIERAISEINISSFEDLKNEVSKIANSAIEIANNCYREDRLPTEQELIKQVSWSISLLKAVIKSTY